MYKEAVEKVKKISDRMREHHTSAYAAQSAYFFVLSLIPMILLLMTLVLYTPVTKADVMGAVVKVFPTSVNSFMLTIVNQVYNQSRSIIPITALVAMWSAGRGVLSMAYGLNCVYDNRETRNYLVLRIRATFYTVLFIGVIAFLLVLSVFGNSLSGFVYEHAPLLSEIMEKILHMRAIITIPVLIVFAMLIYKFLPNHKTKLHHELPGAIFTACGWMMGSFIFSIYLDVFKGFKDMYGSLTTIVLIMLWLYLCMFIMLLGAELNQLFDKDS